MAWFVLFLAGLCEVSWAVGLKYTDGFSRIWPTAGTLAAMALSVALLGLTLRWLPLGTAYAVWTGVGMVGTALLGIVLFEEPADLVRMLCISVIMAGIVGLKLVSPHYPPPSPPVFVREREGTHRMDHARPGHTSIRRLVNKAAAAFL